MSTTGKRLVWISIIFFIISIITRVGLGIMSDESFSVSQWIALMGTGFVFDLSVLPYLLLPWCLYELLVPQNLLPNLARRLEQVWAGVWGALYLTFLIVVAVGEFTFWNEFSTRFDFIAVDYLIYTHEVIGNIRESYPISLWLTIIIAAAIGLTWFSWPNRHKKGQARKFRQATITAITVTACFASFMLVDHDWGPSFGNSHARQLSYNGLYAFGHAYQHNELDYVKYYPTLRQDQMDKTIRGLIKQSNAHFLKTSGIERKVDAVQDRKKLNVILISVESLSAEFLGIFGNKKNLTPELDSLSKQGLLFTNLYATGTRTVRGLEALSLAIPPTPGQSIVRRPKNEHLENLGEELHEYGWNPYWIYGGYGLFDNMNAFFGSNGYQVIDRTQVEEDHIVPHTENVWGIADEDLFTLAITELDKKYDGKKSFFAHIMTTSNHRPYTFPENRIDLPQKHREGAVKYTDWALGDFLKRSKQQPWFDDTLFIIVADHTAKAAGKTDLPIQRYHIPMIWYSPKWLKPATMNRMMSQIDIVPTLLGWMGISHTSKFFGYDIFTLEAGRERAFISTYQKLGYLKDGKLVTLDVNKQPTVTDLKTGAGKADDQQLINEAIAWYQAAAQYFQTGALQELENDEDEEDKKRASTGGHS